MNSGRPADVHCKVYELEKILRMWDGMGLCYRIVALTWGLGWWEDVEYVIE